MCVAKHVLLLCVLTCHQVPPSLEGRTLYNAALYKAAYQSSLYEDYPAYLGNDGVVDANFTSHHCQHTDNKTSPWWMVDLSGQFVVEKILLTNRLDQNAQRLANFTIDVFTADPRSSASTASGKVCYKQVPALNSSTYTWPCTSPIVGRFVRISMFHADYLHFCELEVLVSDVSYQEAVFVGRSRAAHARRPIGSVQADNLMACGQSCMSRRSSHNCTAYSWTPATSECQLLAIDPHDGGADDVINAGTFYFVHE